MAKKLLVWCDLETTGLASLSRILEIGVAVTTERSLRRIGRGVSFVLHQHEYFIENMSATARRMHEANGLLGEVERSELFAYQVEPKIITYLKSKGVREGESVLAGNNISWDRRYLRDSFAGFNEFLHYRCRDVSTLKGELAALAPPELLAKLPKKREAHRSLPDIQDSIEELRFYRKHTRYE